VRIAWEERGGGHPLLLVMGLGYARWGWGPIVAPLADRYRVLTFDNRGIGESDKPEGPYTARAMADDALQVLDEAGIESAHVFGVSLGGMIAQELVVAAPERVDKLVLGCTHPGYGDGYPLPAATAKLFAEAPSLPPEVALRRFVENSMVARGDVAEEVYRGRLANPPDPDGWAAQAAAGTRFAGVDQSQIDKPTLVLTGSDDNVVDARNSELLAQRIPGARLHRFEGTGHLFFWEQPDEVVRIVSEFLG
jgi:pimeloyl-ACP methyl ester carboxylesterase